MKRWCGRQGQRIADQLEANAVLLLALLGGVSSVGCGANVTSDASDPSIDDAPEGATPGVNGGQTGGIAPPRCTSMTPAEALAFDEPSPLGFSAEALLNAIVTTGTFGFTYAEGDETELQLQVAYAGAAGFASCNRNAVDVTLTFTTADAAFDEVLRGRLFAGAEDTGALTIDVDTEALQGNYTLTHSPQGLAALGVSFSVQWEAGNPSGSLAGTTTTEDGVSNTFSVGTF